MKLRNLFEQSEMSVADVGKLKGKTILLRGKVRDIWEGEFPLYLRGQNVTSWYGCPKRINGYLNANNSEFTSWENAPDFADEVYLNLANFETLEGIIDSKSYTLTNCKAKDLKGLPANVDYLRIYFFKNLSSFSGLPNVKAELHIMGCDSLNFPNEPVGITIDGHHNLISKCESITNFKDVHKTFKSITGGLSILECKNVKSHILGFLKIEGLSNIFADKCNDNFEKAIEILNRHVKGDKDILNCQNELIDAGLEEYAQV